MLVDRKVKAMNAAIFGAKEKYELLDFLNQKVQIASGKQTAINAVTIYCRSVFAALKENDPSLLRFYAWVEEA